MVLKLVQPNKSYNKAISMLLAPSRIIGICSLSKEMKMNIVQALHTLVLLLIYIAVSLCYILFEVPADHSKAPNVSIFKDIVDIHLYFAMGCATIALSCIRIQNLQKFLKIVAETDAKLTRIHFIDNENTYKYFVKSNFIGLLECIFFIAALITTSTPLRIIQNIILLCVLYATFVTFVGCSHLLRTRYALINKILHANFTITMPDRYRILASAHDRLCDASMVLNEYFTVQLLGCFTLMFLGTLFAIFCNYRIILGSELLEESQMIIVLRNSYMSVFMVKWGIAILAACSAASEEANETGKVIHKIINNNSESVNIENLKTFSLQLMHRNLSFNACYMFNLDYSLLYTLVGASTTYMVILIQFDLAKPPEVNCTMLQLENKCQGFLNLTLN